MNISRWVRFVVFAAMAIAVGLVNAQNKKEIPDADVKRKSIKSVGYEVGGGATKVIFLGTSAVPQARSLQTKDTPRGLLVNMADVLFEAGKYALSQDAQLKLAKLSGIIQAHPGLNLAIEGHTDTTGSADFNMKLSQQRADTVREFLILQGLSPDIITAKGMGEVVPVADSITVAGRKQNRRVEIIVSGEVIGAKMVAK
jgi:outer membrane protein OmpA-like peptidoglycan-associated protein